MVEREEVANPAETGTAIVTRIYRAANGKWSAEFDLDFQIQVGDGRVVCVRRRVNVLTNEQRGRKRASLP